MTDIDRILAEEGVSDAQPYQPVGNVAAAAISRIESGMVAQAGKQTQFASDRQPQDRQPLSSAYRRRLRRESAEAIADRVIALAEAGSIRHIEELGNRLDCVSWF